MKKKNVLHRFKWNNIAKLAAAFIIVMGLYSLVTLIKEWPERVSAEVDVHNFREENRQHYSNMVVVPVASFETRNAKVRQEVIIVDFNTYFKGDRYHVVMCNGDASCDSPEGRTLTPFNKLDKEEREYYLSFFE